MKNAISPAAALAFWLFIAGDVMFFAAIFATIVVLRAGSMTEFASRSGPAYASCKALLIGVFIAHALVAIFATSMTMIRRAPLSALIAFWLMLLVASAIALTLLRA